GIVGIRRARILPLGLRGIDGAGLQLQADVLLVSWLLYRDAAAIPRRMFVDGPRDLPQRSELHVVGKPLPAAPEQRLLPGQIGLPMHEYARLPLGSAEVRRRNLLRLANPVGGVPDVLRVGREARLVPFRRRVRRGRLLLGG